MTRSFAVCVGSLASSKAMIANGVYVDVSEMDHRQNGFATRQKDGSAEMIGSIFQSTLTIIHRFSRPSYRYSSLTCSEYDIQRILMLNSSASESTSGLRKGSCWCTNRIRYSILYLSSTHNETDMFCQKFFLNLEKIPESIL